MNEVMNMMENATDVVVDTTAEVTPIDCQSTGSGKVATAVKIVVLGGVVIGAIAALVNKRKIAEKIDARQAKRLAKRGYIITRCEDEFTDVDFHDECDE